MPTVVLANDHGAVDLASILIEHLYKVGYEVKYLGVKDNQSVDYPDMAKVACDEFKKGGYEFGILLCGTGIGISISANKIEGIRCALPQNGYAAGMARRHNNANFIAFGGRIDYSEDPVDMLQAFIDASFEGDRHQRRIDKMMGLEKSC